MSNIITEVTARIEDYRATNKQPCKNYATEAAAEKATKAEAERALKILGSPSEQRPVRYVVFFIPAWGRWVGALDFSEFLSRKNVGGHVGSFTGFFSY
jgi:hypothetical protein